MLNKVLYWFSGADSEIISLVPSEHRKYFATGCISLFSSLFVSIIAYNFFYNYSNNILKGLLAGFFFGLTLTLSNRSFLSTFKKKEKIYKNLISIQFITSSILTICYSIAISTLTNFSIFSSSILQELSPKVLFLFDRSGSTSNLAHIELKELKRLLNQDTLLLNNSSIVYINLDTIAAEKRLYSFNDSVASLTQLSNKNFNTSNSEYHLIDYLEGFNRLTANNRTVLIASSLILALITILLYLPILILFFTPPGPYEELISIKERASLDAAKGYLLNHESSKKLFDSEILISDKIKYYIKNNLVIQAINELFYFAEKNQMKDELDNLSQLASQIKSLSNQLNSNTIDIEYGNREYNRLIMKLILLTNHIENSSNFIRKEDQINKIHVQKY